MLPNPLHPAVVHFPIVLMVFLPIVTGAVLWRLRQGAGRRAWGLVILTAALVTGSAWVALRTGQNEEETVERVVAEGPIQAHEEAAERFLLVSGLVLALAAVGALPGIPGRGGRMATLVGALVLGYFGWRVGDLGGKLAYQEGAASAYTAAAVRPGGEVVRGEEGDEGR